MLVSVRRPDPEPVVLVPVARRHMGAIQALAADPEVAATTGLPNPYPPDGAARFIALALQARAQGTGYHLAILQGGRLVGVCGVKDIDSTRRAGEVGCWVGRAHWGQGIATLAVAEVARLAHDELGLRTLTAWSLEDNVRSQRLLEKCGFVRVRRELNARRLVHRSPDEHLLLFERVLAPNE